MDLRTYLFQENITQVDFARKIGYSREFVALIRAGKRQPSLRAAKEIEKATDGQVKFESKKTNGKANCCQNETQDKGTHDSVEKRIIQ